MPVKEIRYVPGKYLKVISYDPGLMYQLQDGRIYAPLRTYNLLKPPFTFDEFLLFS